MKYFLTDEMNAVVIGNMGTLSIDNQVEKDFPIDPDPVMRSILEDVNTGLVKFTGTVVMITQVLMLKYRLWFLSRPDLDGGISIIASWAKEFEDKNLLTQHWDGHKNDYIMAFVEEKIRSA